ncbi:hypothetical protein I6I99_05435 [Sphingobacterium multivorum]|uniref:Lipoprotein n=1 Tax=Sphingobacterium multivorum TaxID=28454 RepID=A0ABX7CK59_SPHMU|nr:hypothetical protein [Sphingobacterium multivorum]QQT32015.1 hypothetical protein I6I99_05435 [Sphingobacterium multivorum]QQT52063.1 hypothetical protein I6I98_17535 [Sphingobacterium multivorum]
MKIFLLLNIALLGVLSSCQSVEKCEDSICLKTAIRKTGNNYLVRLEFKSKMDTILKLDQRMFATGCPDYWEDPTVFYKTKNPDALKHNQIIVENTDDKLRLLSSQFKPREETTPSVLPNCAFLEEFELALKKNKIVVYEFAAGKDQNKLRVSTSDRKVKLHLYLKNKGNGRIITSSNWIKINSYHSE